MIVAWLAALAEKWSLIFGRIGCEVRIIEAGCVIISIEMEVNDLAKPADGTLNEDGWVSVNDLVVHPDSPVGGGGAFSQRLGFRSKTVSTLSFRTHSGDA